MCNTCKGIGNLGTVYDGASDFPANQTVAMSTGIVCIPTLSCIKASETDTCHLGINFLTNAFPRKCLEPQRSSSAQRPAAACSFHANLTGDQRPLASLLQALSALSAVDCLNPTIRGSIVLEPANTILSRIVILTCHAIFG